MDEVLTPRPAEDVAKEKKHQRKLEKRLEKSLETAQLSPWERYRILNDLLKEYIDLVELSDRKTRFALVLLGAVNAINLIVLVRPELLVGAGALNRTWTAIYLAAYVALSLYLFFQAIRELKPQASPIWGKMMEVGAVDQDLLGLRFIGDVKGSTRTAYYEKWRTAQFGQVNREIAYNIQIIADALTVKYKALDKLFNGLIVLIFITAGLVSFLVYFSGAL